MDSTFKRVILKISGEALAGEKKQGICQDTISRIAKEISKAKKHCPQIAIVCGGGNFWRGRDSKGMDRATSDYVGMLGTAMNALALQDALEKIGVMTRVQTAIEMREIAEPYIRRRALRHLEKERVVIFAAGTGSPYFSTDTTAALRAAEINAEAILVAKKGTDGVYDKDPNKYSDAVKYKTLSYIDVLNKGLTIMDSTATSLCMDNKIPIIVFGIDEPGNISAVLSGKDIGTIIKES